MLERNDHRIIATFKDIEAAQAAVNELRAHGFEEGQVRLVENQHELHDAEDTSVAGTMPERDQHQQGFFARLFGFDDSYDPYYSEIGRDSYLHQAYRQKEQIVIVDAPERSSEAIAILSDAGGVVDENLRTAFNQRLDEVRTLLLREEQLKIHKEDTAAEEVVVRKEVTTETKTVEVPVSREEIVIERRPLGAQEAASTTSGIPVGELGDQEEVRIQLNQEEVQVEKRTVPREEVRIGKERIQETRTVTENLKREDAKVERRGAVKGRADVADDRPVRGSIDEERRSS